MIKKIYSNNTIKVNSKFYNSKYIIKINNNNNNTLFSLLEYNKNKDEYDLKKSCFNVYSFIEYLKVNKIKKYFSFNENELMEI